MRHAVPYLVEIGPLGAGSSSENNWNLEFRQWFLVTWWLSFQM